MAEISGVATSYDLPNYLGVLFEDQEKPNSFLRLIQLATAKTITGPFREINNTEYAMGVNFVLPSAAQPALLEGANPTASETDTAQEQNAVQIFQEAVELTYSRQALSGQIGGVPSVPGGGNLNLVNPGTIEYQLRVAYMKVARDANYTFLRGTYALPANNASARGTRGVRTAITTHDEDGAAAALSTTMIDNVTQSLVTNGNLPMGGQIYVLGTAAALEKLIALYPPVNNVQAPMSREEAGLQIRRIWNTWATMDLVWEPDLAAAELLFIQPQYCQVVAMPIPGKGTLFPEMLAKSGSLEKWHVYGEMGIDYRSEVYHGVVRNFT